MRRSAAGAPQRPSQRNRALSRKILMAGIVRAGIWGVNAVLAGFGLDGAGGMG